MVVSSLWNLAGICNLRGKNWCARNVGLVLRQADASEVLPESTVTESAHMPCRAHLFDIALLEGFGEWASDHPAS